MSDSNEEKITFSRRHTHMIACDSDGCVFDVMDLKHKECFCPAFIKHFQLQRCARQARAIWEFVNLYSRTRGSNRFKAVGLALDFLATHPELKTTNVSQLNFDQIKNFLSSAKALGEPALARACDETRDPALLAMLAWTREVNQAVSDMCQGLGPFPGVHEALEHATQFADIVVVSQAPRATLLTEWTHAQLTPKTAFVAGQEFGSKAGQIRQAHQDRYSAEQILVLGDAPGDQEAAKAVGANFFPITPGKETESWQRLITEGLPRFRQGQFDAAYQNQLNADFDQALPSMPPWL